MKNISTYIIARINKKHSQNIEDTSSELFQQALTHCNAPTQLLIYRREALMYYLYVRKLNGTGDCFGMCAVVNSWMATDIPQLFGIFEEVFADVVAKGKILTLNKAGDIIAKGEDLKQLPLETHQLSEQLRNKLSHYSAGTILPPADMSTGYGDFRQYELENLTPEDIRQTFLHGWTAIYKREDYETEELRSYRTAIKNLHKEDKSSSKDIDDNSLFKGIILLYCIIWAALILGLHLDNRTSAPVQEDFFDSVADSTMIDTTLIDSVCLDSPTAITNSDETYYLDIVTDSTLDSIPLKIIKSF